MKHLYKVESASGEVLKVYSCAAIFTDASDIAHMVVLARTNDEARHLAEKELIEEFPGRPGTLETHRSYLLKED